LLFKLERAKTSRGKDISDSEDGSAIFIKNIQHLFLAGYESPGIKG
jgi:hypothetical protein